MKHEYEAHHRRSIRLPCWDYRAQSAYFVTICAHQRQLFFENATLHSIAADVWRDVAWDSDRIRDEFVVMPNHMHGIVWLPGATAVGAQQPEVPMTDQNSGSVHDSLARSTVAAPLRGLDLGRRVEPGSLAAIVWTFKAATAKRINNVRGTPSALVWQRNYYERVIRDDRELERAREYILDNPRRWVEDEYFREQPPEGRSNRTSR